MYQIAILLPEREYGKFYHGQLTYTASLPIEVEVPQPAAANVSGAQPVSIPGLNATVASLSIGEPKYFDSLSFVGTEVVLYPTRMVFEPINKVGSVGFEPTTSSAPG
jgi:hypothetical protein